ncbi:hypothetical protein PF003_g1865 [Phytophthora fragariae]|nr:hypothetical protein PF003_g1865 [Phytophthora fragariae]
MFSASIIHAQCINALVLHVLSRLIFRTFAAIALHSSDVAVPTSSRSDSRSLNGNFNSISAQLSNPRAHARKK